MCNFLIRIQRSVSIYFYVFELLFMLNLLWRRDSESI